LRYNAVVDLCAELPFDSMGRSYVSIPVLDLTVPTAEQCITAAAAIERLHQHGPLLVCCALGYSRSAMAVAAWLLSTGRAGSVAKAVAMIQTKLRQVVLRPSHRRVLELTYGP
jgi:protein-tyrosine phosphatase